MSTQFGKLISFILNEYFGETIEKIGTYLFKCGSNPLSLISKNSGIDIEKTKQVLCFLIKYGFVKFEKGKSLSFANYSLCSDKVYLLLRYTRYLANIKKKYGNNAEAIFEQILQNGYFRASDTILSVSKEKETVTLPELRDAFVMLVNSQFIMRVPVPELEEKIPEVFVQSERELFIPPTLDMKQLNDIKLNGNGTANDTDIYWQINIDRCHQEIRDLLLIDMVKRRFDSNTAELFSILLKLMYVRTQPWENVSNPIPIIEIKDILRKQKKSQHILQFLDQYLYILEDDPVKLIQRIGDASGGQYIINMKQIIDNLTWATIENIISEKYGPSAARIFRLVREKRYIESDSIQQIAMIPSKDAKRLTYQLLEENFFQMRELKKNQSTAAGGSGPVKTFTLFHINFDQVVRMVLNNTYKCIYNIKVRRKHFSVSNKAIIDKKLRADAIELELKLKNSGDGNEQLEEEIQNMIAELITPAEKEILNKIGGNSKKLNTAALYLDETAFLLQLYIFYNTKKDFKKFI